VLNPRLLESSSLKEFLPKIDLVVNATSAGMWPETQLSPWPCDISFPPRAFLYDLVYNPPVTALVQAWRDQGLLATTGLGMLIEQAALALQLWTGRDVPRDVMEKAAAEF